VIRIASIAVLAATLTACATTQTITAGKPAGAKPIKSVAISPAEGNSPAMDSAMTDALVLDGFTVKSPVPPNARTAESVDAIVRYVDVWRWDIAMFLASVNVTIYDATTGELLANATWEDSFFHGYRDSRAIIKGLVDGIKDEVGKR
jgi:hypothetical protein